MVNIDAIDQKISSLLKARIAPEDPGAAIGVWLGGAPIYKSTCGAADALSGRRLTLETKMPIGSITKQFVSNAFLKICQRYSVGIDDSVGRLLPELHSGLHAVTVRELLSHLSGLLDPYDIAMAFGNWDAKIRADEVLSVYRDSGDVSTPPGTSYQYNNGAYMLVAQIIERMTGEPLERILSEEIFAPLGMYNTTFCRFDSAEDLGVAACHVRNAESGWAHSRRAIEAFGQGGIYSTVDDMLLWLGKIPAGRGDGPDEWRAILEEHVLRSGKSTGYALGMGVGSYRGANTFLHAGQVIGANAQLIKVPSRQLGVIVMLNRTDVAAAELAYWVVDAGLDELADYPNCETRAWPSLYCSTSTGRVVEILDRGDKWAVRIDGSEIPMIAGPNQSLRQPPLGAGSRIVIQPAPDSEDLLFSSYGTVDRLKPIAPAGARRQDLPSGSYHALSHTLRLTIVPGDGALIFESRFGRRAYFAEGLADSIWRLRSADGPAMAGTLQLRPNGDLAFRNGRTSNLIFSLL